MKKWWRGKDSSKISDFEREREKGGVGISKGGETLERKYQNKKRGFSFSSLLKNPQNTHDKKKKQGLDY